jgi:D-glycero-D-manno-heptose 1,7-bisphosphate phosphatase
MRYRSRQRAIFLDRDGTLVHPRRYPSRPDDLQLYHGIGPALHDVQAMGFRLVVVTNQSGLARGFFTASDLDRMHEHLCDGLARSGVRLDAIYHCPHHPDGIVPELAIHCNCRKPQPGMLLRAASNLAISLEDSWMVGNILDDIEAGRRAGCRTILVDLGTEAPTDAPLRRPHYFARDTVQALQIIQCVEGGPVADIEYLPDAWKSVAPDTFRRPKDAGPMVRIR